MGHHAIRKRELALLQDFLYRRSEGALLISGKRGVGKTSAVFSALNRMIDDLGTNGEKVLPVLVNAPSFDIHKINPDEEDKAEQIGNNKLNGEDKVKEDKAEQIDILEFKRVVLQNIVRRLFNKAEEKKDLNQIDLDIYSKISDLFKRAVAKEVKEEIKDEEMQQHNVRVEKEIIMNLGATKKLLGIAVSFLSAGIVSLNHIPNFGIWNTILPILIGIVPAIGITLSWAFKNTDVKQYGMNQNASSYYLNDFNVTNLQSELEKTLRILNRKQYKVIVVIDELDKMGEKDIIHVIGSLKTLFNQSLALFVLIIGYEYFIKMIDRGKARLKEYTLFSQRIFLRRPLFNEMEEFIDNIIKNKDSAEFKAKEESYHKFRNYACYASKTDFFDVYNVIRDSIDGYDEDGFPLLNIKLSDQKHVIQANLQKVMGQIYSLKAYEKPSDWYKNDLLLDKMYELLTKLTENKVQTHIIVKRKPYTIITFSNDEIEVKDEIQAAALLDLLEYLQQLGFLELTKPDDYEIRGILESTPSKPYIITQEQKDLVSEYKKFLSIVFVYANIYSRFSTKLFAPNFTYENVNESKEAEILDTIRKLDGVGIHSSIELSIISELIKTYRRLTKDVTGINEGEDFREKLERNIDTLIAGQKGYIDNFILLVAGILGNTNVLVQMLPIEKLDSAFDMHLTNYMSTPNKHALFIRAAFPEVKMVIVHNPTTQLREEVEHITERSGSYAIIFNTDKTVEDDFMGKFETPQIESPEETRLQGQISSFLELLNINKSPVPPSVGLLDLKIPMNEKLLTRLIRGIESWYHTASAPTVVAVTPKDKDLNVPINSLITARFSQPMRSSTVTSNTFTLRDSDNILVTGTVDVTPNGLTATFVPSANLSYNTEYTATITIGVTDQTGNPMVSDKRWSFTTRTTPTPTPTPAPTPTPTPA